MPVDARARLRDVTGHEFTDEQLLTDALTHTSYAAEHRDVASYERLEFLGDAVLELATTGMIYRAMPDAPEGDMTKLRASVVDESTLAGIARSWGVDALVRLGRGEDASGGRNRPSILSDVVEAILGALYLDGGWEAASAVVERWWGPAIEATSTDPAVTDPRSTLQELLARHGRRLDFTFERSGPDHATEFEATAIVDGSVLAKGKGSSKKSAAVNAARAALEQGVGESVDR